MNDSMKEFTPKPTEAVSSNSIEASLNRTVSERFRNLVPERARAVAKAVSRRALLAATGVSLIIGAGCGNAETLTDTEGVRVTIVKPSDDITVRVIPAESTAIPIPPLQPPHEIISTPTPLEPNPTETFTSSGYRNLPSDWGIKIAYDDKYNLPIKYMLEDGTEMKFNMEEMKRLREKAITTGENQIVTMVAVDYGYAPKNTPTQNYSKEHPRTAELPKDVLSQQELMEKGVVILQGDGESENLFIRKSAFEKGGVLADFNQTGRKLTIVLANGSTLDSKYLNDPQYAEVIKLLREKFYPEHYFYSPVERKAYLIKNAEADSNDIREVIGKLRKSNQPVDPYYEEALWKKKKILYKYQNLLTDEQIAQEPINAAGYYFPSKDTPIILLSFSKEKYKHHYVTIYISSNVGATWAEAEIAPNPSAHNILKVQASQTYPNPENFGTDFFSSPSDPESYPYGPKGPGLTFRHEAEHDFLISQAENSGNQPNRSEYDADMGAMEGIREAWKKWEDSGYTDNTGYHFVFSLPKEQGGGYILTRKRKEANRKISITKA